MYVHIFITIVLKVHSKRRVLFQNSKHAPTAALEFYPEVKLNVIHNSKKQSKANSNKKKKKKNYI